MTENSLSQPTKARLTGAVIYHNAEKGYGKIHAHGMEYFFHATACRGFTGGNTFRALVEGTPVTFSAREVDKGPRAFAVRVDEDALATARAAEDVRGNR